MDKDIRTIHKNSYLAIQYLSSIVNCYAPEEENNKHFRLLLSKEDSNISTIKLNEAGEFLSFNYERFTLEWSTTKNFKVLRLQGTSHKEIMKWLSLTKNASKFAGYCLYKFHYKSLYEMTDNFVFELSNPELLGVLFQRRVVAHTILSSLMKKLKITVPIYIDASSLESIAYLHIQKENYSFKIAYSIPTNNIPYDHFYIGVNNKLRIKSLPFFRLGNCCKMNKQTAELPYTKNAHSVFYFLNEVLAVFDIDLCIKG